MTVKVIIYGFRFGSITGQQEP